MVDKSNFPAKRQPDPRPPTVAPVPMPSLFLYFLLVAISIALIVVAFSLEKPDWPGLLINLATGLISAVVILILVDQRLKANELQAIQDFAMSSSVRFATLFPGETKTLVSYASVLSQQLRRIRPDPYIERPAMESLLDNHRSGFILYGEGGSGKSTLVQVIAAKKIEDILRHPKHGQIPIFSRIANWADGNLPEQLWKDMYKYSRVKRRVYDQLLMNGRALVILDGLDEHWQPELALREVAELRSKYPDVSLIITSRSIWLSRLSKGFDNLDLPRIEMPRLSNAEVIALLATKKT